MMNVRLQLCRATAALLALAANSAAQPAQGDAKPPALWFPVGETLVYRLRWGLLPLGTARMESRWVERDGRKLLLLRYTSHTNRVFDRIRPVDDVIESLLDPDTFLPVEFTRTLIRRRPLCDETTQFDRAKQIAHWHSRCSGKQKAFPIKPDTRDWLTFMYLLRKDKLPEKSRLSFPVVGDDKVSELVLTTHEIRKLRLGKFGKVPALALQPHAEFKGLVSKDWKMWMWVTDDARRLVARIAINMPIGSVKATLCRVQGPGDDFWTRRSEDDQPECRPPVDQ